MGNETERNQQNPGQGQNNPGNQSDANRKNPSQGGQQGYKQQDPSTRKPGQDSGTTGRSEGEGSEDAGKRRAS